MKPKTNILLVAELIIDFKKARNHIKHGLEKMAELSLDATVSDEIAGLIAALEIAQTGLDRFLASHALQIRPANAERNTVDLPLKWPTPSPRERETYPIPKDWVMLTSDGDTLTPEDMIWSPSARRFISVPSSYTGAPAKDYACPIRRAESPSDKFCRLLPNGVGFQEDIRMAARAADLVTDITDGLLCVREKVGGQLLFSFRKDGEGAMYAPVTGSRPSLPGDKKPII